MTSTVGVVSIAGCVVVKAVVSKAGVVSKVCWVVVVVEVAV